MADYSSEIAMMKYKSEILTERHQLEIAKYQRINHALQQIIHEAVIALNAPLIVLCADIRVSDSGREG